MGELPRAGALAQWRLEMWQGGRGHPDRVATWRCDALWAAACKEKAALDLEAEGDVAGARYFLDWSRLVLLGCPAYVTELRADGEKITVPAPASKEGKDLL